MGRTKQVSDEEIIRVTRVCVLEKGPQVPSLEIAKRLGVSEATLFSRFGSKKTLLVKAFWPHLNELEWYKRLQSPPDGSDFQAQLSHLATTFMYSSRSILHSMRMMRLAGVDGDEVLKTDQSLWSPAVVASSLSRWFDQAKTLGHVQAGMDSSVMANSFLGMFMLPDFIQENYGQKIAPDGFVRDMVKPFYSGVRA